MLPDAHFQAAFLRAALRIGVIHEREVSAWGEAVLGTSDDHHASLADVVLAPPELTAMREALRPLAVERGP